MSLKMSVDFVLIQSEFPKTRRTSLKLAIVFLGISKVKKAKKKHILWKGAGIVLIQQLYNKQKFENIKYFF